MQSDTDTKFRRPESILLVIYTEQGETLLLKRQAPRIFWQSVTGSVRWQGETPHETAVRELAEETGIFAKLTDVRDWQRRFKFVIPNQLRHRYQPGVQMNVEHLFSIKLSNKVPIQLQVDEHSAYQWVTFSQAEDIVWSWSNREAIRMIQDQESDPLQRVGVKSVKYWEANQSTQLRSSDGRTQ